MFNEVKIGNHVLSTTSPAVIIPLVSPNLESLERDLKNLPSDGYDLIEWRLDLLNFIKLEASKGLKKLKSVDTSAETAVQSLSEQQISFSKNDHLQFLRTGKDIIRQYTQCPIIWTFRSTREGGTTPSSDEYYIELLNLLLENKLADAVDVEWTIPEEDKDSLLSLAKTKGITTLLSSHNFNYTPSSEEILQQMKQMTTTNTDIIKVAVMARNHGDVVNLWQAMNCFRQFSDRALVTMAMGGIGVLSRVCGHWYGSTCTFSAVGRGSAPGQLNIDKLNTLLAHLERK